MRTGWSFVTLKNTIVADNSASGLYPDVVSWNNGSVTPISSYNLIGDPGNSGLENTTGYVTVGAGNNPGITALGDYGGETETHALLNTSPAIDKGSDDEALDWDLEYLQRIAQVHSLLRSPELQRRRWHGRYRGSRVFDGQNP